MSETPQPLPEELQALLARAREAAPGPERLAGVRARLEAKVGPLDAPRATPATPVGTPLGTRALLGVATVIVVIGVGTWLGTRGPVAHDAPGTEPAGVTEGGPTRPGLTEPSASPPSEAPTADSPRADLAAPTEPPASAPVERPAPGRAEGVPRTARAPATTATEPTETVAPDPRSSLREEIALLDRAIRASEAGDPAGARAALAEHRARFPTGTMSPERDRMLSELSAGEPLGPVE